MYAILRYLALAGGISINLACVRPGIADVPEGGCNGKYVNGDCVEFGHKPTAQGPKLRARDPLLEIKSQTHTGKDPKKLYAITITCQIHYRNANDTWGLFVNKSRTTSHVIALTTHQLASKEMPTAANAVALVNVYSVTDSFKDQNKFLNNTCGRSFIFAGKNNLYLAATVTQSESNTPGPAAEILNAVADIFSSIGPLFHGTTFASHWQGNVGAVPKVESDVGKIIATLDKGQTVTVPSPLFEKKTTVKTPYSDVSIQVEPIGSLVEYANKKLEKDKEDPILRDFWTLIESTKEKLNLGGAADTKATAQKCGQYARDLITQNLSFTDVAYALAYSALQADLDNRNTLACLGQYATEAIRYKELWAKYNVTPPDPEEAAAVQPSFSDVQSVLDGALYALGGYLQTEKSKRDVASLLRHFSTPIVVENLSDIYEFSDKQAMTAAAMADILSAKATHVGCLYPELPPVLAVAFAFTGDGSSGKWKPSDAVAMHFLLNPDRKIARIRFSNDDASALLESALAYRKSRTCGSKGTFTISKPE